MSFAEWITIFCRIAPDQLPGYPRIGPRDVDPQLLAHHPNPGLRNHQIDPLNLRTHLQPLQQPLRIDRTTRPGYPDCDSFASSFPFEFSL
jgi:hypothetical protein